MTNEEYFKSFFINNKEIKLGIDDYGQCLFIEFINGNNEIETISLGTYNLNYMEEIYSIFDKTYITLLEKKFLNKPFLREIKRNGKNMRNYLKKNMKKINNQEI